MLWPIGSLRAFWWNEAQSASKRRGVPFGSLQELLDFSDPKTHRAPDRVERQLPALGHAVDGHLGHAQHLGEFLRGVELAGRRNRK